VASLLLFIPHVLGGTVYRFLPAAFTLTATLTALA
jgi:hypothetical protein